MSVSPDFDALYREYAPRVRALARRRLSGRHVSEDVVQEVFLRAFRAEPPLDPDRPVWPWLRQIAVNVCTDVLRAPRTWAEESVGEVPEALAGVIDPDPTAALTAAEHRRLITDALAKLSPRHRDVLLRRAVLGVTSEDMAEGEGTTIEAVKSVVKRSRRSFRQAYNDLGRERGLLGTPAAPPVTVRGLAARVRHWVADVARSIADNPALQSLPAVVSTAVLLFGFGRGPLRPAPAGAETTGSDTRLGLARGAAAAGTGSPFPTARPGGGGTPPSPPPGHQSGEGGGKRPSTVAIETHHGLNNGRHYYDLFWTVKVEPLPTYTHHTRIGVECETSPTRSKACDAVDSVDGQHDIGYWS
jgi:RNA polymerase sigma-70 factor (ECF subfamily)